MATGTNESEKVLDIRDEGRIMKDLSNEKGFLFKKDENLDDLLSSENDLEKDLMPLESWQ